MRVSERLALALALLLSVSSCCLASEHDVKQTGHEGQGSGSTLGEDIENEAGEGHPSAAGHESPSPHFANPPGGGAPAALRLQRPFDEDLERDLSLAASAELYMGRGSSIPAHGSSVVETTPRRLQAAACPGCTCVAMHVGACDEISIYHNYGTDCIADDRCAYNDQGTTATCMAAATETCAAIADQVECDGHASCTYDSGGSICVATDTAACEAQAANGDDACTGAGDCTYDSGTADDVCEAAEAAACSAESGNGDAACDAVGDCVHSPNEDARITGRSDGSEYDIELSTKLSGLAIEPSAICNDPMAENTGAEGSCTYDCDNLVAALFPGTTQTTRCFLYDVASGSWPTELTDMIQTSKPWDPSDPASIVTVADNTIYIPIDESWIIQGVSATITTMSGTVGGLPPVLDARIASGSRDNISTANVALRGFRITSQTAPLDSTGAWYTFSNANINSDPAMRLGGAVSFEGHGSRLLFERMVFDHSVGTSGGGIFVYGHFQQNPDLLRTQIDVLDCLFWGNQARWMGGDLRLVDIWPLDATIENSNFLDSWSFLFHTVALSQNANAMNAEHAVGVHTGSVLSGTPGQDSSVTFRNLLMDGTNMDAANTLMPGWGGIGIDLIFVTGGWERPVQDDPIMHTFRQNCTTQNYECEFHNGYLLQNYLQGAAGMRLNNTVSNSDFWDNKGKSGSNQNTQGGITGLFDWLLIENSRFRGGGFMDDTQSGGEGGAARFEALEKVTIRYTSFDENWAALGGAIAASGPGAMDIRSCSFTGNKATRSGGAIEYKFLGPLDLVSSVFIRNIVDTTTPPPQDVTIRVYTGAAGNPGAQSGDRAMLELLWYVTPACDPCTDDDLPSIVDGSVDHIPGITIYGAYGPYQTYSEQVSLAPGAYTLFHGSELNTQVYTTEWTAGGWIDAVGFVDRVYVTFADNRNSERDVGCYHGSDSTPITDATCPLGQKFWSQTQFEVGFGDGGGLSVAGSSSVSLSGCTFSDNLAGNGNSLYGTSVNSLDLVETTVDAVPEPLQLFGVILETCNTKPCPEGYQCSMADSSRFCTECGLNEVGDGSQCLPCTPGTEPNTDKTRCVDCQPGSVSDMGICNSCSDGIAPDPGQSVCTICPSKMVPDEARTSCVCENGYFEYTAILPTCYTVDYKSQSMGTAIGVCVSCSDLPCIDECGDKTIEIAEGWSLLEYGDVKQGVFKCKKESACPGGLVVSSNDTIPGCNAGYIAPLCGVCDEQFAVKSDGSCEDCGEVNATQRIVLIIVIILVIVLLVQTAHFWFKYLIFLKDLIDYAKALRLKTILKIVITTLQIAGALTDVLSVKMPTVFQNFLSMNSWVKFDFLSMLSIGCLSSGGYYASLFTYIFVLLIVTTIILVVHQLDMAGASKVAEVDADSEASNADNVATVEQAKSDIKATTADRLFFLVFLMYPGFTNKIFEGFNCRTVSEDDSILIFDYDLSCSDDDYWILSTLCGFLLLLWPIGVPVLIFVKMFQDKDQILAEDPDTLKFYEPVLGDYDVTHWYWEIVELARKLTLTGLISVFNRGSITQTVLATLVSFFFFASSIRQQPFDNMQLNWIKCYSEFQIFGILLVCVVLQTDANVRISARAKESINLAYYESQGFAGEFLTEDDYGMAQVVLMLSMVPIALYFVFMTFRDLKEVIASKSGGEVEEEENPSFEDEAEASGEASVFEEESGKK